MRKNYIQNALFQKIETNQNINVNSLLLKNKKEFSPLKKKKKLIKILILGLIILFVILNILLKKSYHIKKINSQIHEINNPMLPESEKEYLVKDYTKTEYNKNNIRYKFHELYEKREVFKINYNYYPYEKINVSLSFDENAYNIYSSTGILNITKLDYYYNQNDIDTSRLNHIHLSMSFDSNYVLLSSISIASILDKSSDSTYIHFHIILNNCSYNDIKTIVNTKKMNEKVDFVFYNGKQAEYDFGYRKEHRGVGEYSRLLLPL